MKDSDKEKLKDALGKTRAEQRQELVDTGHDTDAGRAAMRQARGRRGVPRGVDGEDADGYRLR